MKATKDAGLVSCNLERDLINRLSHDEKKRRYKRNKVKKRVIIQERPKRRYTTKLSQIKL